MNKASFWLGEVYFHLAGVYVAKTRSGSGGCEMPRNSRWYMVRITKIFALFSLAALGASAAEPAQNGTSIELMDRVRVAFYEKAPANVAASMRAAVQRKCSGRRAKGVTAPDREKGESHAAESGWLCDGRHLNFLRSVDVLGNRQKTGFVCNDQGITRNMKFFLEDMFTENRDCKYLFFNAKNDEHFFDDGGEGS